MQLEILSWNVFHGRDAPPDPALHTRRSRLLGMTERNATHLQVNRDLLEEFAGLVAAAEWDLCLLQECPPRWARALAGACSADWHSEPTSRNRLGRLRSRLARANPDLLGANEGGSNLTLTRRAARPELSIVERLRLVLPGEPRLETRVMALSRLRCGACVGNLHAANDHQPLAERQVREAARVGLEWAAGAPLVLGGDFNLRPDLSTLYDELVEQGFSAPGQISSIDQILVKGMRVTRPVRAWPVPERELRVEGLALRLSDHAPVQGAFAE